MCPSAAPLLWPIGLTIPSRIIFLHVYYQCVVVTVVVSVVAVQERVICISQLF